MHIRQIIGAWAGGAQRNDVVRRGVLRLRNVEREERVSWEVGAVIAKRDFDGGVVVMERAPCGGFHADRVTNRQLIEQGGKSRHQGGSQTGFVLRGQRRDHSDVHRALRTRQPSLPASSTLCKGRSELGFAGFLRKSPAVMDRAAPYSSNAGYKSHRRADSGSAADPSLRPLFDHAVASVGVRWRIQCEGNPKGPLRSVAGGGKPGCEPGRAADDALGSQGTDVLWLRGCRANSAWGQV